MKSSLIILAVQVISLLLMVNTSNNANANVPLAQNKAGALNKHSDNTRHVYDSDVAIQMEQRVTTDGVTSNTDYSTSSDGSSRIIKCHTSYRDCICTTFVLLLYLGLLAFIILIWTPMQNAADSIVFRGLFVCLWLLFFAGFLKVLFCS